MKHLFTALLALFVLVAVVANTATAGVPCVINCPSMSPACIALSIQQCAGGWIEGSVIWFWGPTQPDQKPTIKAELTSRPILPDDHFQVFANPPKKDHTWGGDGKQKVIEEPAR